MPAVKQTLSAEAAAQAECATPTDLKRVNLDVDSYVCSLLI